MEPGPPLIYREEVVGMLFTLADIKAVTSRILRVLEDDGEEEAQEDDT